MTIRRGVEWKIRQMEMGGRFLFAAGAAAVALLASLVFMRMAVDRAHAAEDLINNSQVEAILAPQKSEVSRGTMKLEPVFWQEDPVMKPKESDKILDPKPSFNPESKSTNARKLLEERRNLGKVCDGNTIEPLRIGVPLKHGFKIFVNVSDPCFYCNSTDICSGTKKQKITGKSITVFEDSMNKLPHPPPYNYCIFDGTYGELVSSVSSGNLDGAAGDVTITSDRINNITVFTMPYIQSGVALLVRRDRSNLIQWTFLTPLSKELWFAIVGFFCFTGFVIWMIERPRNPEYQGSALRQFSTAAYFAFSTLTFSHGHIVRSPLSQFVVVIWCFVVLVLVQSYTASLSSLLTTDRLQPSVKDLNQLLKDGDNIGYQNGSFVHSLLIQKQFAAEKLFPYFTEDDYAEALRKGSKNGGVSAIVDEVPYLKAFLSDPKYKDKFEIQDQIFRTPGFGFVFNACHQHLVNDLSSKILDIEGTSTADDDASLTITKADSTPLTLRNFSGLFLVSGLVSSLMLLLRIAKLAYARWSGAEDDADAVQTVESTNPGDEHPPEKTTDSISIFINDQPHPKATNGDHQGGHGSGGSVGHRLIEVGVIALSPRNSSMKQQ